MTKHQTLELDYKIEQIVEQYKNFEIEKDVAQRELRMLGLENTDVERALGMVLLNG